jgi:hypothetical protein
VPPLVDRTRKPPCLGVRSDGRGALCPPPRTTMSAEIPVASAGGYYKNPDTYDLEDRGKNRMWLILMNRLAQKYQRIQRERRVATRAARVAEAARFAGAAVPRGAAAPVRGRRPIGLDNLSGSFGSLSGLSDSFGRFSGLSGLSVLNGSGRSSSGRSSQGRGRGTSARASRAKRGLSASRHTSNRGSSRGRGRGRGRGTGLRRFGSIEAGMLNDVDFTSGGGKRVSRSRH